MRRYCQLAGGWGILCRHVHSLFSCTFCSHSPFDALTLLVWRWEGLPACKNPDPAIHLSSLSEVFVETGITRIKYKCIHGLAPSYLSASCQLTSDCAGRFNLRSANLHQLQVQQTRTCYGDPSFFVNDPAVWNSLPVDLRPPDSSLDIFKDKLKRSFSELSTRCAFASSASLRGINCLTIIIIIVIIIWRKKKIEK